MLFLYGDVMSEAGCKWVRDTLDRVSAPHGAHVDLLPGGSLRLRFELTMISVRLTKSCLISSIPPA
jgi:hypothetical protein